MRTYYVYIMTNRSRTLYTGVTNNLARRVWEHKNHLVPGFTSHYRIGRLVHYPPGKGNQGMVTSERNRPGRGGQPVVG